MYICRLFRRDQPFEQIEARLLAAGSITIGRDPGADWPLNDTDDTLSRTHCTLTVRDGRLLLNDSSTNGTYLANGERAPRDTPVPLDVHESFHLGGLTILIDRPPADMDGDSTQTTLRLPVSTTPAAIPQNWGDAAPPRAAHRDGSLVEAFCEGAKLDSSALTAEDPEALMRRIGAIYQQAVLGLAALMTERARLKAQYNIERTTITEADNNPFKWASTRRLAEDLLSLSGSGFLSDAEAVRASFEDISRHMAAVAVGANAATRFVVDTLSPQAIAAEAQEQGFSLKGRAASCWDIHTRRHAALTQPAGEQDSGLMGVFRDAYAQAAPDAGA